MRTILAVANETLAGPKLIARAREESQKGPVRVVICVPSGVTGVEKRAVEDSARVAGAPELRRQRLDARPPSAEVVEASGMCVDGWIPVDPLTLETAFPDVYAVGDITSAPVPRVGVIAEGEAGTVADVLISGGILNPIGSVEPRDVAINVLDAIARNRSYVFTDHHSEDEVKDRLEAILAARQDVIA